MDRYKREILELESKYHKLHDEHESYPARLEHEKREVHELKERTQHLAKQCHRLEEDHHILKEKYHKLEEDFEHD